MSVKFKTFFKISRTWKSLLGQRELCCMLTDDNHQNQEESSSGEDALTDSIVKPWLSHDRGKHSDVCDTGQILEVTP